jgi:hypothetical protein
MKRYADVMMRDSCGRRPKQVNRANEIGKVFRVEHSGRRCLLCGRLFTPETARGHAKSVCKVVTQFGSEVASQSFE